ncbi:hypothetical protein CHUAL_002461 [Chamberlinius hualienensis]
MSYSRRKSSANNIPPRWLKCPRKASDLVEGKFLAFKTPLSSNYDSLVTEEFRFYPSMLLASMSSYKVKIGLWVDLTNTSRFYDSDDVESAGVKYVKLQCRGHGECPSEDQTRAFIELCSNFTSKHPNEVIGVHCTHGFNRTGFLVCAYLVENQSWSIEAAVRAFSTVRQPGIYKEDYLRELFTRYGDPSDTPMPVTPDWCLEYDDGDENDNGDDDNEEQSDTLSSNKTKPGFDRPRRKEMNKKNPVFMEGVPGVTPIITQPKLLQIQRKCQTMCNWTKNGFPGLQPVSMTWKNVVFLRDKPYKVSWKADGVRYMMLIDGDNEVYFVDRDNSIFQVANLQFPRRKQPNEHISHTLLDGEMVIDRVGSQPVPRYLVYDIIKFEGLDVGNADFGRRLFCLEKEIVEPRRNAQAAGRIDRSTEPFSVRLKPFYPVETAKEFFSSKFTSQLSHEIDGLIFQPASDPYRPGRCSEVLKWKPSDMNSVDFKLALHREVGEGLCGKLRGYLYVGGLSTPFAELKLSKDLHKYDKKIIECKFENNHWVFMRERTDKSFPNSYETATGIIFHFCKF